MNEPALRILSATDQIRTARIGNLFAVRWLAVPTEAVLDTVRAEVEHAATKHDGLIYCGVSDHRASGHQSEAVKKMMVRSTSEIIKRVAEFHLVLAGSTPTARLTRSIYRAMVVGMRASGKILDYDLGAHARKVEVHETSDAFLVRLKERAGVPSSRVRQELSQGLLLEDS